MTDSLGQIAIIGSTLRLNLRLKISLLQLILVTEGRIRWC